MKLTTVSTIGAPKWFHYFEDMHLLIASSGNPAFKKAIRKAFKPHRQRLNTGQMTDEEKEEIAMKAAATHLLVGWKGIEDDDGNPIEYSPEKSLEILSDPGLYHVYDFVLAQAGDWQQHIAGSEEEAAKN